MGVYQPKRQRNSAKELPLLQDCGYFKRSHIQMFIALLSLNLDMLRDIINYSGVILPTLYTIFTLVYCIIIYQSKMIVYYK